MKIAICIFGIANAFCQQVKVFTANANTKKVLYKNSNHFIINHSKYKDYFKF